jgi:hypothetical protein
MMNDKFQAMCTAVSAALNDPNVTVGECISSDGSFMILGNLALDAPKLSMVAIDDFGRLWKERHHKGRVEMVCILDLRSVQLAKAA